MMGDQAFYNHVGNLDEGCHGLKLKFPTSKKNGFSAECRSDVRFDGYMHRKTREKCLALSRRCQTIKLFSFFNTDTGRMRLFHGTPKYFTRIDLNRVGDNFEASLLNESGKGFYGTKAIEEAAEWCTSYGAPRGMILLFDFPDNLILDGDLPVLSTFSREQIEKMIDHVLSECTHNKSEEDVQIAREGLWKNMDEGTRVLDGGLHKLLENMLHILSARIKERDDRQPCLTNLMLEGFGFAAIHNRQEGEVTIHDLKHMPDIYLEACSQNIMEEHGIRLGQILIAAGNTPVLTAKRPDSAAFQPPSQAPVT